MERGATLPCWRVVFETPEQEEVSSVRAWREVQGRGNSNCSFQGGNACGLFPVQKERLRWLSESIGACGHWTRSFIQSTWHMKQHEYDYITTTNSTDTPFWGRYVIFPIRQLRKLRHRENNFLIEHNWDSDSRACWLHQAELGQRKIKSITQ